MASLKDVDIELTQVEANDGDGRRRSEENEDDDQVVQENLAYEEGNDPPAHIAALSKNFDELKGLIKENPQCIYDEGISEQTVLHDAVESGDLEIVRFVLDTSENYPPIGDNFLNLRDVSDFTPLHLVAIHGSVEIAKLLIKHGASVNPKGATKKDFKTPFHKAAYYGKVELALYLLQQGAVISYQAFSDIIGGGYEKLAKAVIETDQWPLALRGTYKRHGKKTTAFRELIAKMPDVAEIVLNRCTVEKESNKKQQSREGKNYEVLFNYEFIEDYNGGDTGKQESANRQSTAENEKVNKQKSDGSKKKTYKTSFAEITADQPATHRWGPNIFTKANHPLQIMVNYNQMNLLNHPVVGSLVHHKWKKYGFALYITNLFVFVSFLVLLTTFALIVPNPKSEDCILRNASNSTVCPDTIENKRVSIFVLSVFVLILAFLRFVFEFIQFVTQTISFVVDCKYWPLEFTQLLPYVTDWVNWIEIAQYTCTIVFSIGIHTTDCFCSSSELWQTGVVAVFLGWTVLILFISKFPIVGIYVIILIRICITYLKMFLLTVLMVFAFALTFYLIFFDLNIMRSPFADPAISLMKTMTMSTGDVSFDTIFRLDPSGDSDGKQQIQYPPLSYIIWFLFIVFMPVILVNMLTSLAVDDTEKIRGEAQLQNLALQVDQVLAIEELYFNIKRFLPKRLVKVLDKRIIRYQKVTPNEEKKWPLLNDFYFELWGGCRYDRNDVIVRVIDPPKTEVLERVLELEKDMKGIKNDMADIKEDMTDIKKDMTDIKASLLRLLPEVLDRSV